MNTAGDLLLMSNSWNDGQAYLSHARSWLEDILRAASSVLIIPFAAAEKDSSLAALREVLTNLGKISIVANYPAQVSELLEKTQAIYVPGGNTFRLARALQQSNAGIKIAEAVALGTPYIGASAGSVVACPGLYTTNDMPIIDPGSFETLHLVSFQINPHYPRFRMSDAGRSSETRDDRLLEYVSTNRGRVLALRDGSAMRRRAGEVEILGHPATLFDTAGLTSIPTGPITQDLATRLAQ